MDGGFILIFLGMWYGTGRLVQFAKQRITYPRTGYIAYHKKPNSRRWVTLILALLISSSLVVLLLTAPPTISWMPILTGLIVSVMLIVFGWRAGLARFYILAFLALVTGVILSLMNLGNILGLSWLFLLWAPLLLISGGVTLVRYLGITPTSEKHNAG